MAYFIPRPTSPLAPIVLKLAASPAFPEIANKCCEHLPSNFWYNQSCGTHTHTHTNQSTLNETAVLEISVRVWKSLHAPCPKGAVREPPCLGCKSQEAGSPPPQPLPLKKMSAKIAATPWCAPCNVLKMWHGCSGKKKKVSVLHSTHICARFFVVVVVPVCLCFKYHSKGLHQSETAKQKMKTQIFSTGKKINFLTSFQNPHREHKRVCVLSD